MEKLKTIPTNKWRLIYGIIAFLLIFIEVLIALYIHDNFVRPYIGDVLVVIVLFFIVKIILPKPHPVIVLYIFLFAFLTEGLQYLRIVELLGVKDNKFFSILIGTTFDWIDILCYAIGCIIIFFYEWICYKLFTAKV